MTFRTPVALAGRTRGDAPRFATSVSVTNSARNGREPMRARDQGVILMAEQHSPPNGHDVRSNLEVIAGLREVADFLEAHPELPTAQYAIVSLRSGFGDKTDARQVLDAVARALGERATERQFNARVSIEGRFRGARVHADATTRELAQLPPEPVEYEPIIAEKVGAES